MVYRLFLIRAELLYQAMKVVMRDNPRAKRERQYKKLRQQHTQHTPPIPDGLHTVERKIRSEIAIMKKCNHLHVVELHEVIDDRQNDAIYMVIEYLGGGEVRFTNGDNKPILTVEQSRRIIRDAILGLEYLHHQGIIHRDIKPANLLWTYNHDRVKIADFGTAHFCYAQRLAAVTAGEISPESAPEDPTVLDDTELAKRAGTPFFLAPETIWECTKGAEGQPRPQVTKAIDVWALGVTLYCLLFGKTPFPPPGQEVKEWVVYDHICNHDWVANQTMGIDKVVTGGRHPEEAAVDNGELGPVVIHLLDHLLQKDVDLRITLDEVKVCLRLLQRDHSLFTAYYSGKSLVLTRPSQPCQLAFHHLTQRDTGFASGNLSRHVRYAVSLVYSVANLSTESY